MGMKLDDITIEPQEKGYTVSVRWKHDSSYHYVKYAFTTIDDVVGFIKLLVAKPEYYEPQSEE